MRSRIFPTVLLALFPAVAAADTFDVTTTVDGGPGSLRDAIAQANANPGDDTVNVPAGTYLLSLGALVVADTSGSLTLQGAGAPSTTIDAQLLSTAFEIGADSVAIVDDITVTRGTNVSFVGGNFNVVGHLTLNDCAVTDGAATFGGGVRVTSSAGSVTANRCTFSGNSGFGSAIESQQGDITVSNCTLSGNTTETGGVIRLSNGGLMAVRNSTVVNNEAGLVAVGGLAVGAVYSSIVWNNTGGDTNNGSGTWIDLGFNILGDTNGVSFPDATNQIGVDPLLEPLADNGGPTLTHALAKGSPAKESGDNTDGLTTDQRGAGFPRVLGAAADVGAVEGVPAVSFRNAGTNPASYAAEAILIDSVWTATVDNGLAGQVASLLLGFDTPLSLTLGSGQVLLCLDLGGSGEQFTGAGLAPSGSAGGVDSFTLGIPNDPSLCGREVFSQAIQFGSPPFALSNALDFVVGG